MALMYESVGGRLIERSHHRLIESEHLPTAPVRDQLYGTGLAGLKPYGRSGGNIEPPAQCLTSVKRQRWIGFRKMIVRADLDRPIAGIGYRQGD